MDLKELESHYALVKHKYLSLSKIDEKNNQQGGLRCNKTPLLINDAPINAPTPVVNEGPEDPTFPNKLIQILNAVTEANLIFGMANNFEGDVTRLNMMLGNTEHNGENLPHESFLNAFKGKHMIAVSLYDGDHSPYGYLDEMTIDSLAEGPKIIYVNMDFNDIVYLQKLLDSLENKINVLTFDMSTTKFLSWNKAIVENYIEKLLAPKGVFYYPIELTLSFSPERQGVEDIINIIDWQSTRIQTNTNVYRITPIQPTLLTSTTTSLKVMIQNMIDTANFRTAELDRRMAELPPGSTTTRDEMEVQIRPIVDEYQNKMRKRIPVFSNSPDLPGPAYNKHNMNGSSTQAILRRLGFEFTDDNSVLLKLGHTEHDPTFNGTRIYIYQTVCDLLYETNRFLAACNLEGYFGNSRHGPMKNDLYPGLPHYWAFVTKDRDTHRALDVRVTDLEPKCSYLLDLAA